MALNESSPRSVLHVIWSMDVGGAERSVYQLVRAQRQRGLVADVVVATSSGLYGKKLLQEGTTVVELGQRSGFDVEAARRAREMLDVYDIVHFHSSDVFLIREAAKLHHARLFYTHRAGLFRYPLKRRLKYRALGRYVRRSFSVSANTQQGARAAASLFRIPVESIPTLYNGIDFSLLAPTRPREEVLRELRPENDSVRIGTSGNLRDWKRIERLLYAIADMSSQSVQCVVIGDGPARLGLERLRDRLGISDRVTFVGQTRHVGDYLQALDVFTLPSGPEESFGNAAVEAMGVGLPTVVFADGGGLTEHITDGETGFVVRDQTEFVRKLADLVRDAGLRRALGGAALESVQRKYTLATMVDRYGDLYEGRRRQPSEQLHA
jgi:glycosyltransferase involved in cell wall biosynthesis